MNLQYRGPKLRRRAIILQRTLSISLPAGFQGPNISLMPLPPRAPVARKLIQDRLALFKSFDDIVITAATPGTLLIDQPWMTKSVAFPSATE